MHSIMPLVRLAHIPWWVSLHIGLKTIVEGTEPFDVNSTWNGWKLTSGFGRR